MSRDDSGPEYRTRRGALLAAMAHGCIQPGVRWMVEGYDLIKIDGRWLVHNTRGQRVRDEHGQATWKSFTEALEIVAAEVLT